MKQNHKLNQTGARSGRPALPFGLYGITGEEFANGRNNLQSVKELLAGEVKIIQYRAKNKPDRDRLIEARAIAALCREKGAVFLVNDSVDLALLTDADGVHVGQDDLPVDAVRSLIGPNKLVGLSTHSPEQAEAASRLDIDYIGVGPLFPTRSKPGRRATGLGFLEYAVKHIRLPLVAIGGINEANIQQVADRGARHLVMISDLLSADQPADKAKRLNRCLLKNRQPQNR